MMDREDLIMGLVREYGGFVRGIFLFFFGSGVLLTVSWGSYLSSSLY